VGFPGARRDRGEQLMSNSLARDRPAYTLILYGTNDWNSLECRDELPCYTIDALRSMIRQCRDARSLPVVGTIPPVNPNFVDRDATERNQWVTRMNGLIRPMVLQEGAVLADIQAVFLKEANLAGLFADRLHPNDRGYLIMSREWMRAMISPAATTAPSALPDVFRAPGS
jgi:lysophospholipase L1-like esterase